MQLYEIKLHVLLKNNRLITLFVVIVLCSFHLTSCVGSGSDPNSDISVLRDTSLADSNSIIESVSGPAIQSVADGNSLASDNFGPTVLLSYSKETFKKNPISSFMYFVPLISPTLVDRQTSADNKQQIGIISYKRNVALKSFNVVCEFEILGDGFHKNTFDSAGMIAEHVDEVKKGEPLTNLLDYIQFEGEGFGRIEIKGTMAGSEATVTEVDLQFNARNHKSPVTIGLYDIKSKEGHYKYENKSNQTVARVNTLIFKKIETTPRMGIKVASITKSSESDGFWGGIKGAIANLLISPPRVDRLGNETMLDFGYALMKQKNEFTFPKANNIKEDSLVEIDSKQN